MAAIAVVFAGLLALVVTTRLRARRDRRISRDASEIQARIGEIRTARRGTRRVGRRRR